MTPLAIEKRDKALALLDSEDETPLATNRQEDIATEYAQEDIATEYAQESLDTKKVFIIDYCTLITVVTKPKRKRAPRAKQPFVEAEDDTPLVATNCKKENKATTATKAKKRGRRAKEYEITPEDLALVDTEEKMVAREDAPVANLTKPVKMKGWKGWAIVEEEENAKDLTNGDDDLAEVDNDGNRPRRAKRKRVLHAPVEMGRESQEYVIKMYFCDQFLLRCKTCGKYRSQKSILRHCGPTFPIHVLQPFFLRAIKKVYCM
ncbi:hypothetical protein DFH28DRAFT_1194164 [Melampsora americana]|nr:hypothetical protein DFH28DRAFT_1194164 [Melampsora americana]